MWRALVKSNPVAYKRRLEQGFMQNTGLTKCQTRLDMVHIDDSYRIQSTPSLEGMNSSIKESEQEKETETVSLDSRFLKSQN